MKLDLLNTNWAEGAMILIDKPLNWTSFDAIKKVKYLLGKPKIGHSGTLDPLATGLLICCTGKWTKRLSELIGLPKVYEGIITIGSTTESYDLEHAPQNFIDYMHLTNEDIINASKLFIGNIQQIPPIHSAVKKGGKPVYLLARKGKEVELQARNIFIEYFNITKIELPNIYFEIACSSGTYIRSIAHDFGATLNVGGHLSALRRTKIGDVDVADAYTIDEFVNLIEPKS
jgi:tRNA pseudouridine55 synthase